MKWLNQLMINMKIMQKLEKKIYREMLEGKGRLENHSYVKPWSHAYSYYKTVAFREFYLIKMCTTVKVNRRVRV